LERIPDTERSLSEDDERWNKGENMRLTWIRCQDCGRIMGILLFLDTKGLFYIDAAFCEKCDQVLRAEGQRMET